MSQGSDMNRLTATRSATLPDATRPQPGLPRRAAVLAAAAALLALCLLPAVVADAADVPPRDLHLVGDHWTAWDPPAPPAGAEVHVIERGDTLWDLAGRFYSDPYLWPQLWEQNQYVLDAHWIYPGDPLVVSVQVEEVDNLADLAPPGDEAAAEEDDSGRGSGILSAAEAAGAPVPLGSESDIYCSGFIGDAEAEFPFAIIGSEYETLSPDLSSHIVGGPAYSTTYGTDTVRYGMMNGDIVYLDGGRNGGMQPGQMFTAVARQERIRHPVSGRTLGTFYRFLGRVRVLSVQAETAIAEIVHTCDPVTVGSLLLPFEPQPVPLGRMGGLRPINYPTAAENLADAPIIVRSEDNLLTLGEDSVVYIDRGEEDVVPGDIFTIYRMNRPGLPPVVLGELAVLAVHQRSAVARILYSRYTVRVGDRLELK